MRIALGVFNHEANCFSTHVTDLDDFAARQLAYGPDLLQGWGEARSEEAGARWAFDQAGGCELVPLMAARAESGAPMTEETFRFVLDGLHERLADALPVDGVLLVLHGAMMSDRTPDATGEVLSSVRSLVGPDVPIVGTLDLHANVTAKMLTKATALVGYHTAPHVDQYATGERAGRLLLEVLNGQVRPTQALVRMPMILPPEHSSHEYGPLSEVIGRGLAFEDEGMALHVGVYPTQPWLDTPQMASAVVVITNDDQRLAKRLAQELATMFWERRSRFVTELVSPQEAITRAMRKSGGTVIFCDSADATSSGATGDSTAILAAALDAAPLEHAAFLNVVDPQVVQAAVQAGVGQTIDVAVGAGLAPSFFEPVRITAHVKMIADGDFYFKGPGMRGVLHRRGTTAVLEQGGISLVAMERAVTQWDPELYRSLGLEPCAARIVQVKSPMAFRAAYEGIFDEVIVIAAPGAASPDICALPWKQLTRPIYPLDVNAVWP